MSTDINDLKHPVLCERCNHRPSCMCSTSYADYPMSVGAESQLTHLIITNQNAQMI